MQDLKLGTPWSADQKLFLEVPSPTSKMVQLLVPLASPVKFKTHACQVTSQYNHLFQSKCNFTVLISYSNSPIRSRDLVVYTRNYPKESGTSDPTKMSYVIWMTIYILEIKGKNTESIALALGGKRTHGEAVNPMVSALKPREMSREPP